MNETLKKGIVGLAMAGTIAGGSVVVDNQTVTNAEIKQSINSAIEQGKIPEIDTSKVSLDRYRSAWVEVAIENGVPLAEDSKEKNIYTLVRNEKLKHGEKLPAVSSSTLRVK